MISCYFHGNYCHRLDLPFLSVSWVLSREFWPQSCVVPPSGTVGNSAGIIGIMDGFSLRLDGLYSVSTPHVEIYVIICCNIVHGDSTIDG